MCGSACSRKYPSDHPAPQRVGDTMGEQIMIAFIQSSSSARLVMIQQFIQPKKGLGGL